MKIYKKTLIFTLVIMMSCLFITSEVLAITPTLTLTINSDGDTVQLDVKGDANKSVVFYYMKTGSNLQLSYLGNTDSSGLFSTSISTANYGISPDSLVYVTVNNLKSNQVAWPYVAAANTLTLSQTGLALPLGQSGTITAYNNGTNQLYLSNNSNPPVANVYINGNQITISSINYGSTVITVCAQASSPSCASVYVTVQNTGAQPLVFSQSNVTVANGQTVAVTIIGGTGSYLLLNNSNPAAIQASINGSTVNLSASAASGSSSVTVCTADVSVCGIINAIVGNVSSTGITFSQTNPTLNIGQNLSITISGGTSGAYSLFSNTNPSSVQASIANNNLILTANASGSAVITVCTALSSCGSVTATVSYTATGGTIHLSQNNLWLLIGQTLSITISGGLTPYSISGSYSNYLQATVKDNILTITGVSSGSTSVNVCSAGGGCAILSVLVNGTTAATSLSLSQNSVSLNPGQNTTVTISGSGSYSIAYNTNQNIATVLISGSNAIVSALSTGNTNVSICQNGGQCSVLSVSVSAIAVTSLTLSQNSLNLNPGQNTTVTISGSGGYAVAYNTNQNIATVLISGSNAIVSALSAGNTDVSICQNGNQCSVLSVSVIAVQTPTSSSNWLTCAGEKQQCNFTGSQPVRYGANGKYYYGTFSNSVTCSNSIFGDPNYGVAKQCSYGGVMPDDATINPPSTVTPNWTSCAGEKQQCNFTGSQSVRYGSNGKYYYGTFGNGVYCDNSIFGDPNYGVVKDCSYGGVVPAGATIGTPVKYKFTQTLVYGNSGKAVTELQQRLTALGFYKDKIDGKFLTSTVTAVKLYQKSKGLKQTGNMGPVTMSYLNK